MQEKKDHKNAEYEHFSLTVRDAYDLGASVKFYSDIKNNFTLVFPAVGLFDESFMTNMFCKLLLFDGIIAKKKTKKREVSYKFLVSNLSGNKLVSVIYLTWKVSEFGVFLVHIFLHFDWIQRLILYKYECGKIRTRETSMIKPLANN